MRNISRIALLVLGLLTVTAASGFVLWGSNPLPPMPAAEASLISDTQVTVTSDQWLTFAPAASQPTSGLVLYPGGHVDYRAYAPAARAIAARGYLVVIARMPLSLAVLNANAAAAVIAAHPEIQYWAVGGHSLGGAMAASFAKNNPGVVQGLALWAAYPASNVDLSEASLRAVSIYATLDGLASSEEIEASRVQMPGDTTWVTILGGNHAQFGWYGDQPGDNTAVVSRQEQQDQIVQATLTLLKNIQSSKIINGEE